MPHSLSLFSLSPWGKSSYCPYSKTSSYPQQSCKSWHQSHSRIKSQISRKLPHKSNRQPQEGKRNPIKPPKQTSQKPLKLFHLFSLKTIEFYSLETLRFSCNFWDNVPSKNNNHCSASLPAFQSLLFQSFFLNKRIYEETEISAFPSVLHRGYTSCLLSKWARSQMTDLK